MKRPIPAAGLRRFLIRLSKATWRNSFCPGCLQSKAESQPGTGVGGLEFRRTDSKPLETGPSIHPPTHLILLDDLTWTSSTSSENPPLRFGKVVEISRFTPDSP